MGSKNDSKRVKKDIRKSIEKQLQKFDEIKAKNTQKEPVCQVNGKRDEMLEHCKKLTE